MRYNKGAGHLRHNPFLVMPNTYFLNCLRLCKIKVCSSILIHLVLQVVILRYYGLDGDAPEPIASISRRLSPANPKVTIARNRYNIAIRSLRRKLLEAGC